MRAAPPLDQRMLAELLAGDTVDAAAGLIGCRIVHHGHELLIVETEAYHETEPAAHSYARHTTRAAKLQRPPGHAYVYLSYGIHRLINVVTGPPGEGAAVLLRGAVRQLPHARIDPVPGIDGAIPGPGRVGTALAIGLEHDGLQLLAGASLRLLPALATDGVTGRELRRGPRIGITKAVDLPWRFWLAGSRGVSAPRG